MSRVAVANSQREPATPRGMAWACLAVAAMVALGWWAGQYRETVVVPHERGRDLVALFGDAWREPTGAFRVTGGRMEGGVVSISLAAPGRSVELRLEHRRARLPVPAGATVVEQPGNDIVAVLSCVPGCDAAGVAQ